MQINLQLTMTSAAAQSIGAVFVPGDDAQTWLTHVRPFNVPLLSLRFLPLSENRMLDSGDRAVVTVGALCVADSNSFSQSVAEQCSGLTFWCRANRVWLPSGTNLTPELTDSELLSLLTADRIYVWHPSIGLVGHDAEHVLSAADLLSVPSASGVDWDAAVPGEFLNGRLYRLEGVVDSDPGQLIARGQSDIGIESTALDKAPKAPDEKSGAAVRDLGQRTARGVRKSIAKALFAFTSRLPQSEQGNQTLTAIHRWAANTLQKWSENKVGSGEQNQDPHLTTKRENEIKRLLHLLENDPDSGLKYAPPMADSSQQRGVAPGDSRLGRQTDDFELRTRRSSGPMAAWDLPLHYHIKLRDQYRQLALREQQLGRFRRAAYIYAELLNDMTSAAAALEAGRFYQDAAAIYLESLKQPIRAADCLRNGGFWEAAIQIYRNHQQWMKAAELYEQNQQPVEAALMYTHAIEDYERRRDFAAAADIADQRLDNPELATQLLLRGWNSGAPPAVCLRRLLLLHAARANHQQAAVLLQSTIQQSLQPRQRVAAVQVCSEMAIQYPDDAMRNLTRQQTWRLASELLNPIDASQADSHVRNQRQAALHALQSLAPNDRLLQTDSQRFETQMQSVIDQPNWLPATNGISSVPGIAVAELKLDNVPENVRWLEVISCDGYLRRCGQTPDGRPVLTSQLIADQPHTWNIRQYVQVLGRPMSTHIDALRWRIVTSADRALLVATGVPNPWPLSADDQKLVEDCSWLDSPEVTCDYLADVNCSSPSRVYCLTLKRRDAGQFVCSLHITIPRWRTQAIMPTNINVDALQELITGNQDPLQLNLHVSEHGEVYVACQRDLWVSKKPLGQSGSESSPDLQMRLIESFSELPGRMVASPPATEARLVFPLQQGLRVVWPQHSWRSTIAKEFVSPIAAFTSNGILAVCCRYSGQLKFFRLHEGQTACIGEGTPPADRPDFAVDHLTSGRKPNQILAFEPNGRACSFTVPVR